MKILSTIWSYKLSHKSYVLTKTSHFFTFLMSFYQEILFTYAFVIHLCLHILVIHGVYLMFCLVFDLISLWLVLTTSNFLCWFKIMELHKILFYTWVRIKWIWMFHGNNLFLLKLLVYCFQFQHFGLLYKCMNNFKRHGSYVINLFVLAPSWPLERG